MKRLLKSAVVFVCALALDGLTGNAVDAQQAPAASQAPTQSCPFIAPARCRSSPSAGRGETSRQLSLANEASSFDREKAGPLQLQGSAAALRLDLNRATITDVFSALHTAFHVKYRSLVALNEPLSGTYAGSLEAVIARVLNGYNYVIKRGPATIEVMIYGKVGERAVANPGLIPLRRR